MAREAGLEPLADLFLSQKANGPAPEKAAQAYLTDEVPSVEDAIQALPISWPNAFPNGPISAASCAATCGIRPA